MILVRTTFAIATLGAALSIGAASGAHAQSAGSLLDQARASISTMKRSASEVRRLAEGAKDSDRIKYDCVNESFQSMQQDLQLAEATVEAAVGWGVDVAAAALKSVRGTQEQINEYRVNANRCVGAADDEGVEPVGEESTIATADEPADDDGEEAAFDPFAFATLPASSSIPLAARAPAASPTK